MKEPPRSPKGQRRVQTQHVRRVYIGGKRNEAELRGKCGFIGSAYELLVGAGGLSAADLQNYIRTRNVYYRLYQDHPGNMFWWPEHDEKFSAMLSKEAKSAYLGVLLKSIKAWRLENPKAEPVHPDSADWEAEWDNLKFDADKLWPPRRAFLMAHRMEFQKVPGLWEALRQQLHRFMCDFYEVIEYGD
jgi:hypothetical protein